MCHNLSIRRPLNIIHSTLYQRHTKILIDLILIMTRLPSISLCNVLRLLGLNKKLEPAIPQRPDPLSAIPSEIVELIFQLLSDLDRACFALSCKRLHAYYVIYNKRRRICVLSSIPRTLFLRRLQNERWEYCRRCQNLHRRSRWQSLRPSWRCDTMPTIFECNTWCNVQRDDIVDICPCSSITFHQKQHPTAYFRSQLEASRQSKYRLFGGTLTHLCAIQHPLVQVTIITQTEVHRVTKTFQVETQFIFHASKETASSEPFQNISSRLNRYETEAWLKDFFSEVQSDFFIGEAKSNWYQCHGWNNTGKRPYTFNITLLRDLGGDRMPSKGWEDNCHF